MPNVNELLNLAKGEISNLNHGEIFLLRDLFKGYEWNRISRSERLLLGTLFLNYINTVDDEVTPIAKTSSGQQKYIKSSELMNGGM
ncbi:MAG: single-stranded DNA-binding protein [Desulfitobacteriaceae bacterium]|nr:single-stranded DNA-binding protein [Desulfitobacteriaceae bacterium]